MSQILNPSSGGGSGIQTINGDVGSVTGSTVSLLGNTGSNANTGTLTVQAVTGTELDIIPTDAYFNTIIGSSSSPASTVTGIVNTGLGYGAFANLASANANVGIGAFSLGGITDTLSHDNVAVGNTSLGSLTSGAGNTAVGGAALSRVLTGQYNISLGYQSGLLYDGAESSNICIGNAGVEGESHVMRLGTNGSGDAQVNQCFIAGINGNTLSGTPDSVVIDPSTGQLGIAAGSYSEGTYTPTLLGDGTPGTTTYTAQTGFYSRIGNLVTVFIDVQVSATTGTGNAVFSLPFTVKNQNYLPVGCFAGGGALLAFPSGATSLAAIGIPNTNSCYLSSNGTLVAPDNLQIQNTAAAYFLTLTYQV